MRIVIPVFMAACLAQPAAAGTLLFEATDGGELGVSFGLVPFHTSADLFGDLFDGTVTLTSGAASVEIDEENGLTTYSFEPGTVTIHLEGILDPVSGSFTAPTEAFSFTVCEGCDSVFEGESTSDDFFIGFGPGTLDAALAQYLGVRTQTLGGDIDFGLDGITGGPEDAFRIGGDHRGFANLSIATEDVPEPAASLLLALGAAGLAAARRRRR